MAQPKAAHVPAVHDKLRALGILALNGMFDEMDAVGVLRQAATDVLPGDLAIVSSFGADSAVLLHLVAQVDPSLPVYFLETGKHFVETLDYVETLKRHLGLINVHAIHPNSEDVKRFDPAGTLWETDPDSCCHIRKTEPLEPITEQYAGWVTGRKRFQTKERGVLPHFELTSDDRIKVNPLAYFSDADVNQYKIEHALPEHPLFAKGYKSIGCAPCTSVVAEGEDPRAGRWRGLNKQECGIHFDFNGAIASPMTASKRHTLWKDGAFMADPFRAWSEESDAATASYTHVPLPVFVANRDAFLANPHPLGLQVSPGDRIEDVEADLGRFASIAITFPAFTDGRGYSTARLLTERYQYANEIRAVGDVLQDQIPLMRRCGVNALVVTHEPTRDALVENRLPEVGIFYQPVGTAEVPVGTRPFLRRVS
ncbi:phosphoadenylyl-sulfate reductase [Devosia sp. J2-20]|jgi:phosphoadenosine phosphosulfate reductase|uniref:phosphoadenylyl-sulfate reductase n=1 Tax=Devosia TaxID=46913 RepID=UPI0022B05A06|nr:MULTISPECIES: phosphoadenylyl-sulfate reductase [Devosia]MCZ4345854.1 phosphoadenylyl-sulfate reductase [Devosia neptuniae]WDQ99014.1 phosphoadenylyl-sulfate reductase [Devosia sp. J2-20]|tara:strand:- start:9237 stop:10511 length:1275 start_codon:yes stop_codon:yes gene_type:complete